MLCIKATTMNVVKGTQTTNWHLFLYYQGMKTLVFEKLIISYEFDLYWIDSHLLMRY